MSVVGRRSIDTVHDSKSHDPVDNHNDVILDEFNTLEEVREAIRKQGLETCNLIFGKFVNFIYCLLFNLSFNLFK
jgi:hypothetical protein